MPLVAEIGSQLTDPALPYSLTLGGLNVISRLTPYDSIHVVENGPYGVSTMDFEVWDPSGTLTIVDGTAVLFTDEDIDTVIFRGYVDGWASRPAFATGRILEVSCVGAEAWLDWIVLSADLVTSGNLPTPSDIGETLFTLTPPYQYVWSNTILSIYNNHLTQYGTRFAGVGNSVHYGSSPAVGTIPAGMSMREAYRTICAGTYETVPQAIIPILFTVDFDLTFRTWPDYLADLLALGSGLFLQQPDDYTTLVVTDTVAGATAAAVVDFNTELGDVVHEVWVQGSAAANSGLFGDGSGIRGRTGTVNDTTITSPALAQQAASSYLAAHAASIRGTVTIEKYTDTVGTVHAGSLLSLTDDASGATGTYRIYSIGKTFNKDGTQNWSVAFGGLPPSAIRLTRKLTRGTSL